MTIEAFDDGVAKDIHLFTTATRQNDSMFNDSQAGAACPITHGRQNIISNRSFESFDDSSDTTVVHAGTDLSRIKFGEPFAVDCAAAFRTKFCRST